MIASPKKIIEEMKLVRKLRNAYKARYHEIGIGRIVGIILFLMYFTVWPALFKKIWPYLLANYEGTFLLLSSGYYLLEWSFWSQPGSLHRLQLHPLRHLYVESSFL